jgi:SOS-response transcriptional repressor LexA
MKPQSSQATDITTVITRKSRRPIPIDWTGSGSTPSVGRLCVIEASDQSTEPRISDEGALLVNRADKEFQSGKVYVLSFPNEGLRVKRIH